MDENICDEWNGYLMEKRKSYGSAFDMRSPQGDDQWEFQCERAAQ